MNDNAAGIHVALIPAKGASTRLPRKNLLPIGGIPLFCRVGRAAQEAEIFDRVIVSTEDAEIAEVAERWGLDVPFLRPEKLAHDPYQISDVALHALETLEDKGEKIGAITLLLPTFPFLVSQDMKLSWQRYLESKSSVLISVSAYPHPPQRALVSEDGVHLTPLNHEAMDRSTQSFPRAYYPNGAVTIVDADFLRTNRSLHGGEYAFFEIPALRSVDIDTPEDYEFASVLYEGLKKKGLIPY